MKRLPERRGAARPPIASDVSRRRGARVAACLLLAFAGMLGSGAGLAQSPEDIDRARGLFREGVALSAANNWSGALQKFKAVAQVKMTPQVAFNIAECEEKLGKLVSALGNYRLASSSAAEANVTDVLEQTGARIEALEARIPKLVVSRGEGAEAAVIELDGNELGGTQLDTEIPVDPGPHTIIGKVDGQQLSRETVTVKESESKTFEVVIDLELLKKKTDKNKGDGTKPDKPAEPDKGGSMVPGIAVAGAGVAGLAVGFAMLGLRAGTISELDETCKGGPGGDTACPASAEATAEKGRLYTGLAEAFIPLGAIGVGAGIYLIVTNRPAETPSSTAATARAGKRGVRFVATAPGADVAGASLLGKF